MVKTVSRRSGRKLSARRGGVRKSAGPRKPLARRPGADKHKPTSGSQIKKPQPGVQPMDTSEGSGKVTGKRKRADTDHRTRSQSGKLKIRTRGNAEKAFHHDCRADTRIALAISKTFSGIHGLKSASEYGTKGAEAAVTQYVPIDKEYSTHDQMHSEMCAIDANRPLQPGRTTGVSPNTRSSDFKTDLPHCGHCTFFLAQLALPMGTPTKGLFQLAGQDLYPLPDSLKTNSALLTRICGYRVHRSAEPEDLLKLLNCIYAENGKFGSWDEFKSARFGSAGEHLLDHFWKLILGCLRNWLKKHPKA